MSTENTAAKGQIDFYWRPGCPFCMGLERSLNKMQIPLVKHNIWDNPADAAHVRSVADGNETVPTVTIGGTSMVNPSAKEVVAVANREFPGLIETTVDNDRKRKLLRRK